MRNVLSYWARSSKKYPIWIAAQRSLFGELERTDAKEGYGHIFLAIDGPMH
jgi:hypothetical protein